MDGKRLQEYWSNEIKAMLSLYKQFQVLVPAEREAGAAYRGEDGRYVETLIKHWCLVLYSHSHSLPFL